MYTIRLGLPKGGAITAREAVTTDLSEAKRVAHLVTSDHGCRWAAVYACDASGMPISCRLPVYYVSA